MYLTYKFIDIILVFGFISIYSIRCDTNTDESTSHQSVSSNVEHEVGSSSNQETITNDLVHKVERIPTVLAEACSEEGLLLLKDMCENDELFSLLDVEIYDLALRYRTKCNFTFIANLFPFWSNKQISQSLDDWATLADTQLRIARYRVVNTNTEGTSIIEAYLSNLDPNLDSFFKKRLLFENEDDSSSSSSSSISRKVTDAAEAFATGKDGYCWLMRSETFVKTNEMMQVFLTILHQDSEDLGRQLFSSSFLNRSFNIYSICKHLQKTAKDENIDTYVPYSYRALLDVPKVDISLEDSDFAYGFMDTLKKVDEECSTRLLMSLMSTEEQLEYVDNIQLKDYLIFEMDLTKNHIINKCLVVVRPKERYLAWLARGGRDITRFVDLVSEIANSNNIFGLLKNGETTQVQTLMSNQQTRKTITKKYAEIFEKEKKIRFFKKLTNKLLEKPDAKLSMLCSQFWMIYDSQNISILQYLIFHHRQQSSIANLFNEDDHKVLKYFVASLVCQNFPGPSSSSTS